MEDVIVNTQTRKIAFFDIDGTITSEIDGSIPDSTISSIRAARANGNLMFINTGRCFQNVEQRFRMVGFDGYVCGCGTNIYSEGKELLYIEQTPILTKKILCIARETNVDILFESKKEVVFDTSRPLTHPSAIRQLQAFKNRHYDMSHDPESPDFSCDKFVIWFSDEAQLTAFRKVSDPYFTCIDRGGNFREFVPLGFSKASGIEFLLKHYHIDLSNAYAFGDSNNDLSMLSYVPNSVVMGNAANDDLLHLASFVTLKSSAGGIEHALKHYGFI